MVERAGLWPSVLPEIRKYCREYLDSRPGKYLGWGHLKNNPPEYFPEYLLRSYGGVEDIFSDNSPGVGIGPLRSGCGEKTVRNQNFGCADCFPSISEGAVVAELAHGDCVSGPARQPRK